MPKFRSKVSPPFSPLYLYIFTTKIFEISLFKVDGWSNFVALHLIIFVGSSFSSLSSLFVYSFCCLVSLH